MLFWVFNFRRIRHSKWHNFFSFSATDSFFSLIKKYQCENRSLMWKWILPWQVGFSNLDTISLGKPLHHPHLESIYALHKLVQHLPAWDGGVSHSLIDISNIWIWASSHDCELLKLREHILFISLCLTCPCCHFLFKWGALLNSLEIIDPPQKHRL